jgi:hypothetical protein
MRKQSTVSAAEAMSRKLSLRNLFDTFADGKPFIDKVCFMKFVKDTGVLDKSFTEQNAELIFLSVKVGKREQLNFDRFEVCVPRVRDVVLGGHLRLCVPALRSLFLHYQMFRRVADAWP